MRELDRRTIEENGTPGEVLMERAGAGLAASILRRIDWTGRRPSGITAVAGHGNNGGDAFVAAAALLRAGHAAELLAAFDPADLSGDALVHFRKMQQAGVPVRIMADPRQWQVHPPCSGRIIIDGLLGTGARGPARGAAAAAIAWINKCRPGCRIAAVDVPSGLDAATGEPCGDTVEADWTVTMAYPKTGLLMPASHDFVGNLEVVDIGIPESFVRTPAGGPDFISQGEAAAMMPLRRPSSHKGDHGACVIIAGSGRYPGAAVLGAMGAVRSGVGLVYVITAGTAASAVAAAVPEAIVRGVSTGPDGGLEYDEVRRELESVRKTGAVAAGPGLTECSSTLRITEWLAANLECGAVFDADCLNAAGEGAKVLSAGKSFIITPHPGEAARLLGCTAAEVQSDRHGAADRLSSIVSGVCVLKGAGTIVSCQGRRGINLTGNAGMAKGGSGDVLAGLIAGLMAQGLPACDAAELGVFVHGRAGDIAAMRGCMAGMTAGDSARCLPDAFASLWT